MLLQELASWLANKLPSISPAPLKLAAIALILARHWGEEGERILVFPRARRKWHYVCREDSFCRERFHPLRPVSAISSLPVRPPSLILCPMSPIRPQATRKSIQLIKDDHHACDSHRFPAGQIDSSANRRRDSTQAGARARAAGQHDGPRQRPGPPLQASGRAALHRRRARQGDHPLRRPDLEA